MGSDYAISPDRTIREGNSLIDAGGHRGSLSPAAALVRQHDRDRFQTALFAPHTAREALFALYAFNYEVARVRETVREPMLGQIRLQWWREAIDAAFAGGAVRAHPIVEAVTAAIHAHRPNRELFDRLIDARERGLDDTPHASLAALEAYVEGTAATLAELALEMLGVTDEGAREAARHAGIAYGLAGVLRALPHHARGGRTVISRDIAIKDIVGVATAHLRAARVARRQLPRAALPALLGAKIAARTLRRLERADFDPFAAQIEDDPLQSWRLALAAMTGRY
jgi:phytoene synthase